MFELSLPFYVIVIFCSRKSNLPLKPGDAMCWFKVSNRILHKTKKVCEVHKDWGQLVMNFLAGVTFKSYESNGAFHLSELTCQIIPVVTRISLLKKTIQPDMSNPKQYARRRWLFSKNSWKKLIALSKWLGRPWSGRPVLTFGKHPKHTKWNNLFVARQSQKVGYKCIN